MRIWVISAFEPIPSDGVRPTRYMGVASALLERGHDVTFWTGSFRHYDKTHRAEYDVIEAAGERYTVRVLRSWGYEAHHSPRRLLAHRHLGVRLGQAFKTAPQPDAILISTPPLGTVSAAVRYARRRGVPIAVDVIDPWPDAFETLAPDAARPLARLALAPLSLEARSIFRGASGICGISQQYVDWARAKAGRGADPGRPSQVFYPSVNVRDFDEQMEAVGGYTRTYEPGGTLRFAYAGSFGSSYDVETIIACARRLHDEGFDGAEFHIAGDGPKRASLEALAEGLTSVRFLGWVGADELARLYAAAHVGIACYARGATQSVTYKLFDYLAAGLPILNSLPSEMAAIIERERVGYNYAPEDVDALVGHVRRFHADPAAIRDMSVRGRAFAEEAGDNRVVYRRMAEFLESL